MPKGAGGVFTFDLKAAMTPVLALVDQIWRAVEPSRQHRRHALAYSPSGLNDAPSVDGRATESRRCRPGGHPDFHRNRDCRRRHQRSRPAPGRAWRPLRRRVALLLIIPSALLPLGGCCIPRMPYRAILRRWQVPSSRTSQRTGVTGARRRFKPFAQDGPTDHAALASH